MTKVFGVPLAMILPVTNYLVYLGIQRVVPLCGPFVQLARDLIDDSVGNRVPLFSIFLVWIVAALPFFPSIWGATKLKGGYNNKDPRSQKAELTGWVKRSYAAHLNGVENIAPWAAVVFSLLYTGNNTLAFSALCLLFVCSRVLFVVFYIANLDVLRTIVFHGGLQIIVMGFCMAIFKPSVLATFLTK